MIPDLQAVAALLANQEEPDRLQMLGVFQDLTLAYLETRQMEQAEAQLPQAKALCQELDHRPIAHQLEWIEGLMAKARKEPIQAERFFRQAKAGFNEIGDNVSGAIAALEIGMLCHAQGRSGEVLALMTTEVIPVIETLELHREELGALALLRKAAAEKNLSLTVLDEVRRTLRAIRCDPASMGQGGGR
jgi:tetratricopeptide (TPR) repeat protein